MTFKLWLVGFLEAALSSGMTALSTNWVDPHDFNFATRKFWLVTAATAGMSAVKYTLRTLRRLSKENPDSREEPPTSI